MPLTSLDKNTALVLIDLQKGIASRPVSPYSASEVIQNAALLVAAFRKANLPIVIVNVIPGERPAHFKADAKMPAMAFQPEWAEIVPEIEVKDEDIKITKHTWSAFYDTDLDTELNKRDIQGIVLAGIASSIGVEGTARAAFERGYNISFASDAMADMLEQAHNHSINIIFPRIGEVDTTAAIVEMLEKR